MNTVDLFEAIGGQVGCQRLSEAFYARVQQDPTLRPLFPGKSLRCAVEAFAAFLVQLLGGPPEHAEKRWWLSLRDSHQRFNLGPMERQAWMANMLAALNDVPMTNAIRGGFRELFERSSAYLANIDDGRAESRIPQRTGEIGDALASRWNEQQALDELVAAVRADDFERTISLAQSERLRCRFARDASVLARVLALMMRSTMSELLQYVRRQLEGNESLVHVRGRHGRTLLHEAAAAGNLQFVELLLELGADPNATMAGGHAPLYCAANECLIGGGEVVRVLAQAGARPDAQSGANACTALHMAARRGNIDVARALIECGADRRIRDKNKITPVQRAENCRKTSLIRLLEANVNHTGDGH